MTQITDTEWERMWESETATGTVHRAADDDEWQVLYDKALALWGQPDLAVKWADAHF